MPCKIVMSNLFHLQSCSFRACAFLLHSCRWEKASSEVKRRVSSGKEERTRKTVTGRQWAAKQQQETCKEREIRLGSLGRPFPAQQQQLLRVREQQLQRLQLGQQRFGMTYGHLHPAPKTDITFTDALQCSFP